MKVYVETYGCALNKADASLMKALLLNGGHEVVDNLKEAEAILVNTCTVRKDSEERILRRLRDLSRTISGRKLIIAGCMVSTQPYTLKQVAPTASLISPQNIAKIVDVVESQNVENLIIGIRDTSHLPCNVEGRVASIPIAEGCVGNCAYCIVKLARRKLTSYKPELIVKSVREAVSKGAAEIELTAQDTAAYGIDLGGINLAKLIKKIVDEVEGNYMIRVGMANPNTLKPILDNMIEILKEPKVFKYIHIPLQSGDDKVLKIMKREYTVDEFVNTVKELRKKIPGITIATDIIVGHPGEGEEEFENTLNAVNTIQPDKVHIAQYAPRPRTESTKMLHVSEHVKKRRSTLLTEVVEEICLKINKEYVGSLTRPLIITKNLRKNTTIGRLFNYKLIIINGEELSKPTVLVVGATFYDLRGISISSATDNGHIFYA
ncbi:MAG: tRNA (N(6)-L-threonylcarbamoyladenosine(37)-C(2))-methylthiotransferase [Sulfolobales archaeon]|nr:tRNA (N(6)-L-threonylcarbamoyladenosine(37)-C(2))-methylthiotransferase [Sulfolobales archaeon]